MHMGEDSCKMSMIFNTDIKNICIVFKWWHIRGWPSAVISLLAVVALGVAYEYLRTLASSPLLLPRRAAADIPLLSDQDRDSDDEYSREYRRVDEQDDDDEGSTLADLESAVSSSVSAESGTRKPQGYLRRTIKTFIRQNARILRALLYSIQVVYSFFIMLIAMTYNVSSSLSPCFIYILTAL